MSQKEEHGLQNNSQDFRFENFLSRYYRITLFFSALFMAIGIILFAINPPTDPSFFDNINTTFILQEITNLSSAGFMFIGIIILLLIPFVQVVIFLIHYLIEKDYPLTIVASIVIFFMLIGIIFDIK